MGFLLDHLLALRKTIVEFWGLTKGNAMMDVKSESANLVARGKLLAESLRKQALAAKVEAQHADLELALAEAEAGDPRRLREYLQAHSKLSESNSPLDKQPTGPHFLPSPIADADIATRSVESQPLADQKTNTNLRTESNSASVGWTQFVSSAELRLTQRFPLGEVSAVESLSSPTSSSVSLAAGRIERVDAASGIPDYHRQLTPAKRPEKPDKVEKVSREGGKRLIQPTVSKKAAADALANKKLALELAAAFKTGVAEDQQEQHRKATWFGGMSGVSTSILLHILMLLPLMFIAIKLPKPPASMSFDSAVVGESQETFELTQPLDVAPSEVKHEPTDAPTLNLAESMPEVDIATESVLSVQATSVPPSSMATASTVTSKAKPNLASAAKFFGTSASGNSFCYVIDGSGSMRGGPWEAAKAELLRSLSSLSEKQRFYIIFYNREIFGVPEPGQREPADYPLYATSANLEHARRWIETLKVHQGGPPNEALQMAIDREPDAIYLLTDGVTKVDVAGYLRTNNRSRDFISGEQVLTTIHTIAFYSLEGQDLLKRIAMENNGQFIYVPKPKK